MPCSSEVKPTTTHETNMRAAQIIAFLLPESRASRRNLFDVDTATALIRDDQGRMSLQPTKDLAHELPFAEQVMTTGCFRRGKEIIDPVTREVLSN